eukprot:SAG31_NODE_1333_length_8743_cov_1.681050_12_plen_144_part_00
MQFFYDNGFVVLTDVIAPDALDKLQAAWMAVESEELPKWEEARVHGVGISRHTFHSMEGGYSPVGRKTTGFSFDRLLELEPRAALDPLDNPVRVCLQRVLEPQHCCIARPIVSHRGLTLVLACYRRAAGSLRGRRLLRSFRAF